MYFWTWIRLSNNRFKLILLRILEIPWCVLCSYLILIHNLYSSMDDESFVECFCQSSSLKILHVCWVFVSLEYQSFLSGCVIFYYFEIFPINRVRIYECCFCKSWISSIPTLLYPIFDIVCSSSVINYVIGSWTPPFSSSHNAWIHQIITSGTISLICVRVCFCLTFLYVCLRNNHFPKPNQITKSYLRV